MSSDPNYLKKTRLDMLYDKKYETYTDLRADLAAINSSIVNEASHVVYDSTYDSHSTIVRSQSITKTERKKYSKKRVYGIVVGNSKEIGRNVYVDVPLHNSNIVVDDSILLLGENVDLENYQELIFYPIINSLQIVPELGTICAVIIPDNYPNHIITNPEDAIFLEVYRKKVISPANFNRPQRIVVPGSLRDRILKSGQGGASGGVSDSTGGSSTSTGGSEGTIDTSTIPSDGTYNEEVRKNIIQSLGGRPEPSSPPLHTLTEEEVKTYSLSMINQITVNGWFILNPQIPSRTPRGSRTIASENHVDINKLLFRKIPAEYCGGDPNNFIYEEALYSYIKMRIDLISYLDEAYTKKGITFDKSFVLRILEAYRTWPQQQKMIDAKGQSDIIDPRTGKRGLAAPQGRSNHQGGLAMDLNGMISGVSGKRLNIGGSGKSGAIPSGPLFDWMKINAWKYGWRRTVSIEIWHWEFRKAWIGVEYTSNDNNNTDRKLQYIDNLTGIYKYESK